MELNNLENNTETEINGEMAAIEQYVDSVIEQDDQYEFDSKSPIDTDSLLKYITYNIIIYTAEGKAYFAGMEVRKKENLLNSRTVDQKWTLSDGLTIQDIDEEISHLKKLEGEARDLYFLLFNNVEYIQKYIENRKIGNVKAQDSEDL